MHSIDTIKFYFNQIIIKIIYQITYCWLTVQIFFDTVTNKNDTVKFLFNQP